MTQSRTEPTGTDPRARYVPIGTDTQGAHHVYRTTDETIHVIEDGRVAERFDLDGRSVDDYVRFVADVVDGREWTDRKYLLPGEVAPFIAESLARPGAGAMAASVGGDA